MTEIENGLQRIARLAVIFYVRYLFAAASASIEHLRHKEQNCHIFKSFKTTTINNCLQLLQKLSVVTYKWYLNEELVPLALFDDGVRMAWNCK